MPINQGKTAFIFTSQGEEIGLKSVQLTTFWTCVSLAKILIANGIKPNCTAGLSLGELSSLAIAKVFSLEELEQILAYRQTIMDEALAGKNTGMLYCIGLPLDEVKKLANKHDLIITNYNAPMNYIVSGHNKNLTQFETDVSKNHSVVTQKIPTTGAFHSPFLNQATVKMREYLQDKTPSSPTIPIYFNSTGNKGIKDIRKTIAEHISNPVMFQKIIENMIQDGVTRFIVIGIGTAPVNMIRQNCKAMNKRVTINKVESLEDIRKVVK